MAIPNFEFATAARIVFGAGTLATVGPAVRVCGARALVVCGHSRRHVGRLLPLLEAAGVAATVFEVGHEPTTADVERGVAVARGAAVDCVVGIGGGSALDAAKAVAALLTNPGPLTDYLEVVGRGETLARAGAPCIAIPTTAGTGAEVTRNAVLAVADHRVKVSLRSPLMLPRLALVDPELTYDLPPALTATTGLDALTQVIEPYVSSRANPITDALCRVAVSRVGRSLRRAVFDGRDKQAREDMAFASLVGGLALANAGLGAVHGFAGPIGGAFPAPHGATCAALLPHVTRVNLGALRARAPLHPALERYNDLARMLSGRADAAADDLVNWLHELVRELRIPQLGTYGITSADVDALVGAAGRASSMKANPVVLTPDECAAALTAAL